MVLKTSIKIKKQFKNHEILKIHNVKREKPEISQVDFFFSNDQNYIVL